jgi:receptor-type tyrosine-protein phosphatase N
VKEEGVKKQPLGSGSAKNQNSEGSRTSSTSSWHEDPGVTTMDISTGHMVLNYMEDHLNNKQRLEQEWVGLCAYEAEPSATTVAFKVENRKKNRYPDKLPYDHNRVLLNALVNGDNSDYINASTVTDHDPRNPGYMVTQGPLAHTVADFWQMVWEQGSVVLVMLSRLSENGYHLVHRYWPEEGSQTYHIYEVHLVSEHVWCDDYLVRSLYLKNTQTGETRTVTQFHFLAWPDRALPESTKSLLEFRRKVNKSYRGRSCPIIVHCSDGVGRSGTYVLLDMVLNRMSKGSKEIDIAATLEHIRDQRSGMVQTKSQFEFCLTAVAEETHAILKSLAQ